VLLEGAGSPAEINLVDLVNNRMCSTLIIRHSRRRYRSRRCLCARLRHLGARATGDPRSARGFRPQQVPRRRTLLELGPTSITERTAMALAGVLLMLPHDLPDEEGASIRRTAGVAPSVAVVRYPYAESRRVAAVRLRAPAMGAGHRRRRPGRLGPEARARTSSGCAASTSMLGYAPCLGGPCARGVRRRDGPRVRRATGLASRARVTGLGPRCARRCRRRRRPGRGATSLDSMHRGLR
jgi:hypothetical protein